MVVDGEDDGENVFCVVDEAAGGGAGTEVAKAELTVLGPKGAKLAVGGEEDIHGG